MEIKFPQHQDNFILVNSLQDAKNRINQQNFSLNSNILYRWTMQKQKYLYGKCCYRGCKAYLAYRQLEAGLRLFRFYNQHNHTAFGSRQSLFNQVENDIKEMPISISAKTARQIILRKYNLSKSSFYYLFRKIQNKKIGFYQLTQLLSEKKCEVQSQPYFYGMDSLPNHLLIVSPLMKYNFQRYGDWMGFDLTYNVVQQRSSNGRSWALGVFMGISASKKMVPFGLVLCNQQNSERLYSIFKSFSDIMNRLPHVIISDDDKATAAALESLKKDRQFEGIHLLDVFHILRNIKKNLKNKKCWDFFNRMIRQQSKSKFLSIMSNCLTALDEVQDIEVLQRFQKNSHRYCLSQIPNVMYGFMPNTSMNQKVHDLIKSIISTSKPFTVVVQKVMNLLEDLGEKCSQYELETVKIQDLFQYVPLKEIRFSVSKVIFKEVTAQFSKCIHHRLEQIEQNHFQINDSETIYMVQKNGSFWQCQCSFYQKCGILCSHLFKTFLLLKISPIDYIHPRWKLQITSHSSKKNMIRQKKTRRNR